MVNEGSAVSTKINRLVMSDLEWSGKINRSLDHGRAFALLLSMLESDVLDRPRVVEIEASEDYLKDSLESTYRNPPLVTGEVDWLRAKQISQLFATNPKDGLLFQVMHPQPLSLYNDAHKLDDQVMHNCDHYTQARFQNKTSKNVTANATGLYDVLQQLDIPVANHS